MNASTTLGAAAHRPHLAPALDAEPLSVEVAGTGTVHVYAKTNGAPDSRPLLLIHTVNAAASAYEIRPIFEGFASKRPVYALDLPGFGLSERPAGVYTPERMTSAIGRVVEEIRDRHGDAPIDALAVSLSCEFLARVAAEEPGAFRTVALVSPTGLEGRGRRDRRGSHRGMPVLRAVLGCPLWWGPLFRLLAQPPVVRYFLRRTYGARAIDEGLWRYAVDTAAQPGAEHAPLSFLSGYLFSDDATLLYEDLTMPVWMSHGTRGDFVDYRGAEPLKAKSNWTVRVFEAGALPYFEVPKAFLDDYGAFLERQAP